MKENKHVQVIIQARMGSKRFPGKALATINDMPILEIIIRRLQKCKNIDSILVATTTKREDDAIASMSQKLGITCFRGEENDVLTRFVAATQTFPTDIVVRVTADNPLTDPTLVDELVSEHLTNKADYTTAVGIPTGTGAEVINSETLTLIQKIATDPDSKEHVTLFVRNNPAKFRIKTLKYEIGGGPSVTVDTKEDLTSLRRLVSNLGEPISINISQIVLGKKRRAECYE